MTMPYKVLIVLAILAVTFFAGYRTGVKLERGKWEHAALRQAQQSHKQEQQATVASEQVADTTRQQAEAQTSQVAATTVQTVERIRNVYHTIPAACPDARPVPDSVRRELDQARAALAAAR